MEPLLDGHGRRIGDLRVSVTDRCNFRCQYCMPAEGLPWLDRDDVLHFEEIERLIALLADMGVRDTLSAFAQASAQHDYRRVCADLLAKPVIDSVRKAGLSCESAMKTALKGVESPKLEVLQVTIKGNRASAKVHTTAANQQASDDTVALVKEGESWKIGALAGR